MSQDISPFLKAANSLDHHFSELNRLGNKIEALGMKSDSDFEQAAKLMKHFSEHGEGVAQQVQLMSQALIEARAQAEQFASQVSSRAEMLHARQLAEQQKMEAFRVLGEKVRKLNEHLSLFKKTEDANLEPEERSRASQHLRELEQSLRPLIEEAHSLKNEARLAKMKALEQGADSLGQTLTAVGHRISTMTPSTLS